MKKIFITFCLLFTFITECAAAEKNDYFINLAGNKYRLLYSTKNKETGGYFNEYFKRGETYNIWSEMVAIHHFPNAYLPFDQIKEFKNYLESYNCPSSTSFDDKNNSALIDFVMINSNKLPVVLEFNVFKYIKSDKCGSIAIQYAKRYTATNTFQVERLKKEIEKIRKQKIKHLKHFSTQFLVESEIDKCKFETAEVKTEENKEPLNNLEENFINDNQETEDIVPLQEENTIPEAESEDIEDCNTDNKVNENIEEQNKNIEETVNEETVGNNPQCFNINETKSQQKNEEEEEEEESSLNNTEDKTETKSEKESPSNDYENNDYNDEISEYYEYFEDIKPTNDNLTEKNIKPADEKIKEKKVKTQKKEKEKTYKIINNKDEYISKPISKRELKIQIKEAKRRVKEASKKLNENL